MFVYGRSVLALMFGLLILSFYPMGSLVLRVHAEVDSFETSGNASCYIMLMFRATMLLLKYHRVASPCFTVSTNF